MRLLVRIRDRMARGDVAPSPTEIPGDKDHFPKLVCLDMNHWIYLAQAHHGRREGEKHKPALEALQAATSTGKVVVPILPMNFVEAAEGGRDRGRRERLAAFMVDLSGNQSLVANPHVRRMELRRAVCSAYLGEARTSKLRSSLLRWGMLAALGKDEEVPADPVGKLTAQVEREPEISERLMTDLLNPVTVASHRELDREAADNVSQIRKMDQGLEPEERRLREVRNLLTGGSLSVLLDDVLRELGVERADFDAWLDDRGNVQSFGEAVPHIDVTATLMISRDKNQNAAVGVNDGKDFGFLELAIPYANIVATEKLWASVARSTRLDKKYATMVVGTLTDVRSALEELGCL